MDSASEDDATSHGAEAMIPETLFEDQEDQGDTTSQGAPRYSIPLRQLSAVEVPAIINNIDRAVKAFGRAPTLRHVSTS